MILRAFHFKPGPELVGTIVLPTDEGEPTGVEHSGNYSKGVTAMLVKKAEEAGLDRNALKAILTDLLRQIRQQCDAAASGPDRSADDVQAREIPQVLPPVRAGHPRVR